MAWLHDCEKNVKICLFFHMIHERDRQTDTQTDRSTPHADIGRAYASHASRGNKKLQRPFVGHGMNAI